MVDASVEDRASGIFIVVLAPGALAAVANDVGVPMACLNSISQSPLSRNSELLRQNNVVLWCFSLLTFFS